MTINSKNNLNQSTAQQILDNCFIAKYNNYFSEYLQNLSPETRELIRKNKDLNSLFDLFLDFILDSSQYLDYRDAKEQEKNSE